jgi:hypothetical protein
MTDSSDPAAHGGAAEPERRFGWWDMWASPEQDPREAGGPYAGERATLVRYLRDRRLTLEMKCAGLDAEGMACRSATPDPAVVADAWSTWRAEVAFGPRRPVAGRP